MLFIFNNGSLLDRYGELSYQQLAYIVSKWSFHNLNLDKTTFKSKKDSSDFLENLFFFHLI